MSDKLTQQQFKVIKDTWSHNDWAMEGLIDKAAGYLESNGIETTAATKHVITGLINPLTRDFMAEIYVEPEDKYYWRVSVNGKRFIIVKVDGGFRTLDVYNHSINSRDAISESDMIAFGFDISKLIRESVQ